MKRRICEYCGYPNQEDRMGCSQCGGPLLGKARQEYEYRVLPLYEPEVGAKCAAWSDEIMYDAFGDSLASAIGREIDGLILGASPD